MGTVEQLFSDDSDSEQASSNVFEINKSYMNNYKEFRKKEEQQRLKDREGLLLEYESESGESDEGDSDEVNTEWLDHSSKLLEAIKSGKKIEGLGSFPTKAAAASAPSDGKKKKKKVKTAKPEEPYTLQSYMRDRITRGDTGEDMDEAPEPSRPRYLTSGGAAGTALDDSSDADSDGDLLLTLHGQDDAQSATHVNFPNTELSIIDQSASASLSSWSDSSSDSVTDVHKVLKNTAAQSVVDTRGHKSYPAVIETSTLTKDPRRKDARLRQHERRKAIKAKLREEVKELQAIKHEAFKDRLEYIQKISGQTRLGFDATELDEDFDPTAHDRAMQETFGDEYYDGDLAMDEHKPRFEYDGDIDGDIGNYDDYEVQSRDGEECEADDESPTATPACSSGTQAGPEGEEEPSRPRNRRGKKKRSSLRAALEAPKPLYDPEHHNFNNYWDEYYGLDFEDVIGGDLKCRFKYRTVEPNNFGLTTEEILGTDDSELNRWYSLKNLQKVTRTTEEEYRDRKVYSCKAHNLKYKKKMLPSHYNPPVNKAEEEEAAKEKTKLKKTHRKLMKAEIAALAQQTEEDQNKRKRVAKEDCEGRDDEPNKKRFKYATTTEDAREEEMDDAKRKRENRLASKQRSERKLRKEGFVPPKTKADLERRHRHDVVAGDQFTTVLKLTEARLDAYGLTGVKKLKKFAAFRDDLEQKGGYIKDWNANKKKREDGKNKKENEKNNQKDGRNNNKNGKNKNKDRKSKQKDGNNKKNYLKDKTNNHKKKILNQQKWTPNKSDEQ